MVRIQGFNKNYSLYLVVHILHFVLLWDGDYRFGVGEFDWKEFTPRLKQKSYEEIREYLTELCFICFYLWFRVVV